MGTGHGRWGQGTCPRCRVLAANVPAVPTEAHTPSSLTWRRAHAVDPRRKDGACCGSAADFQNRLHVAEEMTLVLPDLALASLWWFAQIDCGLLKSLLRLITGDLFSTHASLPWHVLPPPRMQHRDRSWGAQRPGTGRGGKSRHYHQPLSSRRCPRPRYRDEETKCEREGWFQRHRSAARSSIPGASFRRSTLVAEDATISLEDLMQVNTLAPLCLSL